ncbi:hypothetical protein FTO74_17270 [Granulicella sp. WH15]|nr:hypothetical protein FTO74_17270 [Granulicella sp. WH15]
MAAVVAVSSLLLGAQTPAQHRTRLYLKDGSYQIVLSYTVAGSVVRFVSAERDGQTEEIPVGLIDFEATKRWEQQHFPAANGAAAQGPRIDPELAQEEAERASRTPEVAHDLRLPEREDLLALDTWRGTPELVPLTQSDGELNRQTGHNILRGILNPMASKHQIVVIKGERSQVQLHVDRPTLYLRVGDPAYGGHALTVDTHGSNTQPGKGDAPPEDSRYVIVRTDVRQGARVVASFDTGLLGGNGRQEDVVETNTELLPGGHWRKIVPRESLLIGEYALMEVLSDREINLGVWDFGVHPTAPENRDALRPEPKRAPQLEHRSPD